MSAAQYIAKRFIYQQITGIASFASKSPAGLHEDEVPPSASTSQIAVVYQLESGVSALGNGATHLWDAIGVLVDVIVPGRSQVPGEGLSMDIFNALHGATGPVTGGVVSSCVYRGAVPSVPEHTATGQDYEHIRQRFELHARGTP